MDTESTLTDTVNGEPRDLIFLVISPNPAQYPDSARSGALQVGRLLAEHVYI